METARRQPPDLILSDVGLLDGSGYDFIQAVKSDPALAAIPFIFLTATDCDEKARARGMALGAARFLFRPLEPQAILAEIEACLRPRGGEARGDHPDRGRPPDQSGLSGHAAGLRQPPPAGGVGRRQGLAVVRASGRTW